MTITWHSPAEMLPQVGQDCWVATLYNPDLFAYPMTFLRSGYGTVAAWKNFDGTEVPANLVRAWLPREAVDWPWDCVRILSIHDAP